MSDSMQNTYNAQEMRKHRAFHHVTLSLKEDSVKSAYRKEKARGEWLVHTWSTVNAHKIVFMSQYKSGKMRRHLMLTLNSSLNTQCNLVQNLCICGGR